MLSWLYNNYFAPSKNSIEIKKVAAFPEHLTIYDWQQQINSLQDEVKATVVYPPYILAAFKDILEDSKLLGSSYFNPYTGKCDNFPETASKLTIRHLEILARNEQQNVTGTIASHLYNDLLTIEEIAAIRALTKMITTVGMFKVNQYGGYGVPHKKLNHSLDTIVVDQNGFQWQDSLYNTGSLFFTPIDADYSQFITWRNATYKKVFNTSFKEAIESHKIYVTWNLPKPTCINGTNYSGIIKGYLDKHKLEQEFMREFLQALSTVGTFSQVNNITTPICFRFLKQGLGFFSANLDDTVKPQLASIRISGIIKGLKYIANQPSNNIRRIIGNIKAISLPFSSNDILPWQEKTITQYINLINLKLGGHSLKYLGAENIDALKPYPGYLVATTNCGDPHAMPGNEGGYNSVDAAIGKNIGRSIHCLNAAANPQILYKSSVKL